MAGTNKFNAYAENLAEKKLNQQTDQFTLALTNVAPTSAMVFQSDLTEISYTNLSSRDLTVLSSSQTAGVYRLILNPLTLTASGAVATFRYPVLYDRTPGAPGSNPLVFWWDLGIGITMANGQTFTFTPDPVLGIESIQ